MSRMHITKHAYEDMFEELYPNVRKQYRIRMAIARIALALAILFTFYVLTIGECKKLPFIGSIAERQRVALAQESAKGTDPEQGSRMEGEDLHAERVSEYEYAGFSLASQ